MITEPEVLQTLQDQVLWLKLNRPMALNALTAGMVDSLRSAVATAGQSPDVRVIVLHGQGRAFCVGTDLKEAERRSADPKANLAYIDALALLTNEMASCPRPVIAAINGICMAGGLELALACDGIRAASAATLADGHANFAMFPGGGATARLPRRIGPSRAAMLMFTGDTVSASAALAMGLVDAVVPDDELIADTRDLALRMAARSPLVLARMKQALRDAMETSTDAAVRAERQLYAQHMLAFDRTEGLAAFREKRPPQFQGR